MLFGIKAMLISKTNLIASLSVITTFFLKTKIKSHGNAVIDFYDKKIQRWSLIILA